MEQTAQKKRKKRFSIPLWRRGVRYGAVDFVFFLVVMILLAFGILMMFSASYAWAISEGESGTYYAVNQIINAVIGLVLMLIFCAVDYHFFKSPLVAIGFFVISLLLLVMVLIPGIGYTEGGATRWIVLGGFNFQPSELMKISIVIFFAYVIDRNQKNMRKFCKGMLPLLLVIGLVAFLLLQEPHMSATILIAIIAIILIFSGGASLKQFGIMAIVLVAIAAVVFLLMSGSYDYIGTRINSWLDPFSDIEGGTWQTCQSLIAIGSGGFFGLGLGESRQKYLYLPETKNDFVFAIVCEELGFVGALFVILLFVILVIRGFYIAAHASDRFGSLIAIGFTTHIGLQAFLNIAVVCNLTPNTGISLPFFSYGGTALILQLAEMGIVLNISRTRYRVVKETPTPAQPVAVQDRPMLQGTPVTVKFDEEPETLTGSGERLPNGSAPSDPMTP